MLYIYIIWAICGIALIYCVLSIGVCVGIGLVCGKLYLMAAENGWPRAEEENE